MAGEKMISASISLQPKIWERLQGIIATGRVGSSYLFSGPSGCGKEGIAIGFSDLFYSLIRELVPEIWINKPNENVYLLDETNVLLMFSNFAAMY